MRGSGQVASTSVGLCYSRPFWATRRKNERLSVLPVSPFHAPGHLNRADTSDKMIIIDLEVTVCPT